MRVVIVIIFLGWFFSINAQQTAVVIRNVATGHRMLPTMVFYSDTLSKEFIKEYLRVIPSIESPQYSVLDRLSKNFDYAELFSRFELANGSFTDTTTFRYPKKMISQIYFTEGMTVKDSILFESPFELIQTLNAFLASGQGNFSLEDYKTISGGIESILFHFRPKYYEVVKEEE